MTPKEFDKLSEQEQRERMEILSRQLREEQDAKEAREAGLGSVLAAIGEKHGDDAHDLARIIEEGRGNIPRDNATVLAADYWSDRKRDLIFAFNSNPDIWYIHARNKNGDEFLIFEGPHP